MAQWPLTEPGYHFQVDSTIGIRFHSLLNQEQVSSEQGRYSGSARVVKLPILHHRLGSHYCLADIVHWKHVPHICRNPIPSCSLLS